MIPRPPTSTPTYTHFAYTTLVRSAAALEAIKGDHVDAVLLDIGLPDMDRSEEHTSELQSLMRISYAVFCLKKQNYTKKHEPSHLKLKDDKIPEIDTTKYTITVYNTQTLNRYIL